MTKRISWRTLTTEFLESIKDLEWNELRDKIDDKTGIRASEESIRREFSRRKLRRKKYRLNDKLSQDEGKEFARLYPSAPLAEVKNAIAKSIPNATSSQLHDIARARGLLGTRKLYGTASTNGKNGKSKSAAEVEVEIISSEQVLQNLPLEDRQWDDPEVMEIDPKAFAREDIRVANISRIDYFGEGFRKGLIRLECQLACAEGVKWVNINGGLIDKVACRQKINEEIEIQKKHIKEQRIEAKKAGDKVAAITQKDLREVVENKVFDEAAKALTAMFPKLKKPGSKKEFIRYYIIPSKAYDGSYGNDIARRLQRLRADDMRLYKPGSARTPIKGNPERVIWSINPYKRRLSSKYHSAVAEIEITEKEGQTSQAYPDIWVVGTPATAVYKPSGERQVPYITLPASSRLELEGTSKSENQVGLNIMDYPESGNPLIDGTAERLIRVWSFRDIIANERKLITGIKDGAQAIHRLIVEELKKSGALSVGLLEGPLGNYDREKIEKAVKFLEEPKASQRKTWPGLYYDPSSQLYDFHLDWIQQKLRYSLPKMSECKEDNFLFFGCMHAGYTTVDYAFIVQQFPKIMLKRNTQTLVCLGDLIAGLHHDFMCTGEIFSGLNNTEQEIFAAELVEHTVFKVFNERFKKSVQSKELAKLSSEDICDIVNSSLVLILVICGNHDLWQEKDGNTPLSMFLMKLEMMLSHHISKLLGEMKITCVSVPDLVKAKIVSFPDFDAYYKMPSGIGVAMSHPHMGRAATTSLRAEHAIGMNKAQISGIANFHTATVVHKWKPDLGQCVAVQVGTEAIYTRFEKRKMKYNVDFGPVALRTLSHKERILLTETAYYNKPILKEAIPKTTDINVLKKTLGLVS